MSAHILFEICAAIYLAVITLEFAMRKNWRRLFVEVCAFTFVVVVLLLVNSAGTGRIAFGSSSSPLGTVIILFVATTLGIAARYVFYLKDDLFSWLDFLKPLCISPIVLLPLIGGLQGNGEINTMQVVSLALLAFQNGFFWQAVLAGAKPISQQAGQSVNQTTAEKT